MNYWGVTPVEFSSCCCSSFFTSGTIICVFSVFFFRSKTKIPVKIRTTTIINPAIRELVFKEKVNLSSFAGSLVGICGLTPFVDIEMDGVVFEGVGELVPVAVAFGFGVGVFDGSGVAVGVGEEAIAGVGDGEMERGRRFGLIITGIV